MGNQAGTMLVMHRYEKFVNPALARLFRIMGLCAVEHYAKDMYIMDDSGEKYLDCLGGYGVFSLGHGRGEVVQAVKDQLDCMPMSSKILLNGKLASLAAKLADFLPELPYSFFVNSGAEAVEGALKLARIHTGRTKIIAMENAFHGKTFGALSATGRDVFRAPFQPLVPGFIHVPFGNIDALAAVIDEQTAAVIIEPIQGEGGIVIPPDGYLRAVQGLCADKDALLICDEVQTGLGRTGKMFAVEYDEMMPDIMVLAKSLGGGVMPIGAFCARASIWDQYIENPFLHTSTFGGNQLACAAALATLNVLETEYSSFAVAEKGDFFLNRLCVLQDMYPHLIETVRGRGLMIGIVLCEEGLGGFVMAECIKRHILIAYTLNNPKVMRLEPPFTITFDLIRRVLDALEEIFYMANRLFGKGEDLTCHT